MAPRRQLGFQGRRALPRQHSNAHDTPGVPGQRRELIASRIMPAMICRLLTTWCRISSSGNSFSCLSGVSTTLTTSPLWRERRTYDIILVALLIFVATGRIPTCPPLSTSTRSASGSAWASSRAQAGRSPRGSSGESSLMSESCLQRPAISSGRTYSLELGTASTKQEAPPEGGGGFISGTGPLTLSSSW